MKKTVLVIAAHPDDEILGCGASMACHALRGDDVHVLILAEGATSRDLSRDRGKCSGELAGLAIAARKAGEIVGARSVTLHDFPDNRMDSLDLLDIVKVVESHIDKIRPTIVYTHHSGDVNVDHLQTHRAVVTACRPQPGHPVHTLLFFEIPSSTEWQTHGSSAPFVPNWFVDVSDTLAKKIEALDVYSVEMRPWPHPRSVQAVEHLARWRGASSGIAAAEAFLLGRNIDIY